MIVRIYLFIPLIAASVTFLLLTRYDLDKRYEQVAEALKTRAAW
jgi:hypothetical protein